MDANYIAMIAVLVAWAGVVAYLWRLDRKISRREQSS
jgi:CcmD family protein